MTETKTMTQAVIHAAIEFSKAVVRAIIELIDPEDYSTGRNAAVSGPKTDHNILLVRTK